MLEVFAAETRRTDAQAEVVATSQKANDAAIAAFVAANSGSMTEEALKTAVRKERARLNSSRSNKLKRERQEEDEAAFMERVADGKAVLHVTRKERAEEDVARYEHLLATVDSTVGGGPSAATTSLSSTRSYTRSITRSITRADADADKENRGRPRSVSVSRPRGAESNAAMVRLDHANAGTAPALLDNLADHLMARRGRQGANTFRRTVTLKQLKSGIIIPAVVKSDGRTPCGVDAMKRESFGFGSPAEDVMLKLNAFISGICSDLKASGWNLMDECYLLFNSTKTMRLQVDISHYITRAVHNYLEARRNYLEARRIQMVATSDKVAEIANIYAAIAEHTTPFLAGVEDIINIPDAGLSDDARASLSAGLKKATAVVVQGVQGVRTSGAGGEGISSGSGISSGAGITSGAGISSGASGSTGRPPPASSPRPTGPDLRKILSDLKARLVVLEKKSNLLKTLAAGNNSKVEEDKRNSLRRAEAAVASARAADGPDGVKYGVSTGTISPPHVDVKNYAVRVRLILFAGKDCRCGIQFEKAKGSKQVLEFPPQRFVGDMYAMTTALSRGDYKHRSSTLGEHLSLMLDLKDTGRDCTVKLAESFMCATYLSYTKFQHLLL